MLPRQDEAGVSSRVHLFSLLVRRRLSSAPLDQSKRFDNRHTKGEIIPRRRRMNVNKQLDLKTYLCEGYSRLSGVISDSLLSRLRDLFDDLMFGSGAEDLLVKNVKSGFTYINNVERPCCRGSLAGLEILGFPPVLEIARSICGEDFFCLQDFGVVKMLGDDVPVLWHQDMLHLRTGRCFVMGVYLDDAAAGDGALKVVPSSHTSGRHICELQRETPVDVPMRAGDILVHDMMLAHSSGLLTQREMRRVLYLIFLSASHVRAEGLYSERVIESRTKLLGYAIRHYRQLHPEEEPYEWRHPLAGTFPCDEDLRETLDRIGTEVIKPHPSAYCFEMK